MAARAVPAFSSLTEAAPDFPPTYKFDVGTHTYDTSIKARVPAWTDRILFSRGAMELLYYAGLMHVTTSDHKPVVAGFSVPFWVNTSSSKLLEARSTRDQRWDAGRSPPVGSAVEPRAQLAGSINMQASPTTLSPDVAGVGVVRSEVCTVM